MAQFNHGLSELQLLIKLERARLHRQSTRGGSGLRHFVDQSQLDPQMGQPQCQHQAGGPCAGN